jgi:hypothetical protein
MVTGTTPGRPGTTPGRPGLGAPRHCQAFMTPSTSLSKILKSIETIVIHSVSVSDWRPQNTAARHGVLSSFKFESRLRPLHWQVQVTIPGCHGHGQCQFKLSASELVSMAPRARSCGGGPAGPSHGDWWQSRWAAASGRGRAGGPGTERPRPAPGAGIIIPRPAGHWHHDGVPVPLPRAAAGLAAS